MPLFKIIALNKNTQLLVWEITETFEELFKSVVLKEGSLARVQGMKSESHQKGFLSVRRLLMEAGYTDLDLHYDTYGKPYLSEEARSKKQEAIGELIAKHISISHSHGFSVIALSDEVIGIDLEQLKEKTLKIAPRFMDVTHLENLSHEDQIKKATVVWGIKEGVFKIKNEKGISFPDHIFEHDFTLNDKKAVGELRFNNSIEYFDILFDYIEDYVVVCAFEKK